MAKSPFIKLPLVQDIDDENVYSVLENSEEVMKKNMLLAKRTSKNREAVQQAILIALLNMFGYDVEINKPYKKGNTTMQLYTIQEISTRNDVVWSTSLLSYEYHTAKEKRQYLDAITNNIMISILQKHGVIVEERATRKGTKECCILMKRINTITSGNYLFELEKLNEIGKNINMIIHNRLIKCSVVIQHHDQQLMKIIQGAAQIPVQPFFKHILTSPTLFHFNMNMSSDSPSLH
ncbi:Uncharacterized protein QTN25_002555 [Entamoeba marina]